MLRLTEGRGVDAIVDMDFASTVGHLRCLTDHGAVVCYGSNAMDEVGIPFREMLFRSLSLNFFLVYELRPADRTRAIAGVNRLLADGALSHPPCRSFPLDRVAEAHEAVEGRKGGGEMGNVVVAMASS